MAENNYFSHQSPTYGSAFDMMQSAGVSYRSAGENIARGQKTPAAVMDSWMNSQGHRENILSSSYTSIGVGYAVDDSGRACWVQIFQRIGRQGTVADRPDGERSAGERNH